MVEMLGVLAIMGIVGLVGVRMYTMAMNKHHANTLIEQAQRRAVSAAGQINLMGHVPSLADFSENTFGGGTFGGVTQEGLSKQFGIQVSGVSKAVCENILNAIGENTSLRRLASFNQPRTAMASCEETNTFLMIYNENLNGANGDATYNCDSDTDCSACGTCNTETHACENDCEVQTPNGGCDFDNECNQGNECMICDTTTRTCKDACTRVAYLESTGTQYINTLFKANNTSGLQAQFSVPNNNRKAQIIVGSRNKTGNTTKGRFWIDADWVYVKTGIIWGFNEHSEGDSICPITDKIGQKVTASLNYMNDRKGLLDGVLYDDLSTRGELETQTNNVYIFSCGPTSGDMPALTKVYFIRISDNNTLVRDFVPVLDKDKKPAMFDRVSGDLFYNAGTGTFQTGQN